MKQQQKGIEKDFQDGGMTTTIQLFNIAVCFPVEKSFCRTSVQEVKWTTNWPLNYLTVIPDCNTECMLTLVVFVICVFMCNCHDK